MPLIIKKTVIIIITFVLFLTGCGKGDMQSNPYSDLPLPELEKIANQKYEAILNLAQKEPCTDAKDWKMMDIPTICGPGHFVYHKNSDETKLVALVSDYKLIMEIYSPMISPYIDCITSGDPKGISCRDGKPILTY